MLFVPGNNPGMVKDAGIYGADSIMFDLEDAISLAEKDAARFLIREALTSLSFGQTEIIVRINGLDTKFALLDLEAVVSTGKATIRLPKTETADDVLACAEQIALIEKAHGIEIGSTKIIAAIESARGVLNAPAIAVSHPRLSAIALAAEDYTADLKTSHTREGSELYFGRCMILHAARSAGIDAIDSIFADVNDEEGLRNETKLIRQLGFDGKSCINPRQIRTIHEIFAPSQDEIRHAEAVINAYEDALQHGSGLISLNGKLVDRPVVLRAQRTLNFAKAMGFGREVNLDE
jgi:citrate lyase subunit beta/citryl-CoA lyase